MKKIRVFGHVQHIGHNYDLIQATKGFADWFWIKQYIRPFNEKPRGSFKDLVTEVTEYEVGKYDVAVLHLDNQCVDPEIWLRGKGRIYRELNEVIKDIPKIVINHGTPYFPEKYTLDTDEKGNVITNPNYAPHGLSSKLVEDIKKVIGDNFMVVNSNTAQRQWGGGTAIIHGMGLDEWYDLPKESRVVTMISPAGLDDYYDRSFLSAVKELLQEKYDIELCHITVDWSADSWDEYRTFLGKSLVYFNPTKESPMPRARTEAMLSGCCVITTPFQDADQFIVDGVNGFIVRRDPEQVVDRIKWCMDNQEKAIAIGQNGKKTAQALFNRTRYGEDWRRLFSKVLNREITNE